MIGDIAKRATALILLKCARPETKALVRGIIQEAIDDSAEELQEKLDQSEKHNRNVGAANISQQNWNWKLTAENERLNEMVSLAARELVEWCEICKSFEETTCDSDHCKECRASGCFSSWRCCESYAKKDEETDE